jgi:hypothetical protein
MLIGQVLVWLVIVGVFLASGQASIFHPLTVYLGFHAIVFVIRPFFIHYLGFDTVFEYMLISPSEQVFIKSLLVSSTGLVMFSIAVWLAGRIRLPVSPPKPPPFTSTQITALILATVLLAPPAAYSILASTTGMLTGEDRGGVYVMTGSTGYTAEAQNMIGPIICAWLVVTRFNRLGLVPLIAFVGYRAYCGWSRWTIVLLFLSLALVYAWQKRVRGFPLWAVVLALPTLLLFHALGNNRAYFQAVLRGEFQTENYDTMTLVDKLKTKYDVQEFANFDYLCYVVRAVPALSGTYTYGTQYLQLLTEPIPRKLWPGKPIGGPLALVPLNAYGNFKGLTVSLPGDGWLSGGWLGLVLTMGLTGAFLGTMHRWFWTHTTHNLGVLLYLTGLAMSPQWFRDGGISVAKFLLWTWLPLLVWAGFSWLLGRQWVKSQSVLLPIGSGVRLIIR